MKLNWQKLQLLHHISESHRNLFPHEQVGVVCAGGPAELQEVWDGDWAGVELAVLLQFIGPDFI